jgi:malonyl CoA-acyl carrier protein transacylase
VSAPFHSRYMHGSMDEYGRFLEGFAFAAPSVPVVSNVTARPYEAAAVRETLARQIGNSVRWLNSVCFLLDQGIDTFEEVGPGTVLAKLASQIRRGYDAGERP